MTGMHLGVGDLGEGVEPSALWPAGWGNVMEALAVVREASQMAADEKCWVRGRPAVCWEAMRLQYGRGFSASDVAAAFGVNVTTTLWHKKIGNWERMTADALEKLSRVVSRALLIRRHVWGVPEDTDSDARACEWTPLAKLTSEELLPLKSQGTASAREQAHWRRSGGAPPADADIDSMKDPHASQTWRRDEARRILRGAMETARNAEDVARVRRIEAAMAACQTEHDADLAMSDWSILAHPAQVPPEGAWRTWMLMGGRGAGKTRAGAEWVRSLVEGGLAKRVALVGPSLHEVREVMVAGPSGLCAIGPEAWRPRYESTRRRLVWTKGPGAGAIAMAFSAEDPDGLRGSQFDAAWCDEIGAWAKDLETWKTLAFAMRLGPAPRIVATTTPRPRALVKLLVGRAEAARGGVKMTRAGTRANAQNLSPEFVAALEEDFAGTALARQELDGDLVEDLVGALWSRSVIEQYRASPLEAEGLERVVVAVDPPAGASGRSDACGIVVAGVKAGVVYVLGDATVRGLRPAEWGARVAGVAQAWGAGVVVAESNQGGEMVRDVLREACSDRMRVELRHASKAKRDRAAPVSAMYEQGKVRHVRVLTELEDEMCAFGAAPVRGERAKSPDRVDALVWAVDELMRKPRDRPRVERL